MIRRPTIHTRTDTLCPYTTLFRARLQGERAATIERLGILADHAMGGAIALLSKPEALHLPRQGHDVAVGETVRIARRPGDGGLIKAAAAEIVAPVAERACEQPILPPDRGDGRNAEIGRASCRERVCQYV